MEPTPELTANMETLSGLIAFARAYQGLSVKQFIEGTHWTAQAVWNMEHGTCRISSKRMEMVIVQLRMTAIDFYCLAPLYKASLNEPRKPANTTPAAKSATHGSNNKSSKPVKGPGK